MEDFGRFVVRISDRQKLLNDIRTALNCDDRWQRHAQLELHPVKYSKGEHMHTRTDLQRQNNVLQFSIAQKRPEYAYQFEHRTDFQ